MNLEKEEIKELKVIIASCNNLIMELPVKGDDCILVSNLLQKCGDWFNKLENACPSEKEKEE